MFIHIIDVIGGVFAAFLLYLSIFALRSRVPADKDVSDIHWAKRIEREAKEMAMPIRRTSPPRPVKKKEKLPRPVKKVSPAGYWYEKDGKIIGTPKALAIEAWALSF